MGCFVLFCAVIITDSRAVCKKLIPLCLHDCAADLPQPHLRDVAGGDAQGVDGGGQHPHMVSPGPLHTAGTVLQTTPEVAAAYHNGHFHPHVHKFLDRLADGQDCVKINAVPGLSRQGLAAELEQNALIFRCHGISPVLQIIFELIVHENPSVVKRKELLFPGGKPLRPLGKPKNRRGVTKNLHLPLGQAGRSLGEE